MDSASFGTASFAPPSDAERKARASAAAKCALVGATFTVTDDDRGAPLFVVNDGSATHLFRKLEEVDEWIEATSEVTQ